MIKILVHVKPNSKQQEILPQEDGSFLVYLKSPPTEGKANQELIALLAKHFRLPKSQVVIKLGLSSRQKVVEIED